MRRFTILVLAVSILGLFAAAHPAPTTATYRASATSTPHGRGVEATRAVLHPYLAALVAREDIAAYLADDVILTLVDVGQEIKGRDAVAEAIAALHQVTFDARSEVVTLVVGDGMAAGEFVFIGTRAGEFAGFVATGRQVRVPYAVVYDLADDQITALRLYGFASGPMAQPTSGVTSPQPLAGYSEP